jgi:hypothetical protein
MKKEWFKPTLQKGEKDNNSKVTYRVHDWNDDGKTPEFNPKHHDIKVTAHKDGKEVGSAYINHHDSRHITPHSVNVHKTYRRQGIASGMYHHAEKSTGKKMIDTYEDQTHAAKKLWENPNRPFGKSENELIHYSRRAGLKELDPSQMGTGGTRMKQQPPEHKSTFYYTPESKPEQEVTQGAKSRYTIKVGPEHKIYDLSQDPDKMYQAAQASNQGAFNEDILHGMLKDKGYHGVKWKMRDGTHVVQMYHPMPVHQEQNLQEMEKGGPISPSKHIGYKRLEQIKQDHGIGAGGKEYGEEETDKAIMDRKVSEADKMVRDADRMQRRDPMKKSETYEQETERLRENKKKPEAGKPHKFKAAKWTFPNGHPRCVVCMDEEREGGICKGRDLDKSELKKGAMKRIAPFNPAKDVTETDKDKMAEWQTGEGSPDARDVLGQHGMNPNARKRALHRLSSETPTRRSAEGGQEFLLHRGMGRQEYNQTRKFTPEGKRIIQPSLTYGHTSWTPKLAIAANFKESPSDSEGNAIEKPGGVASAWVHEKHIRMIPKQYGTYGNYGNYDKDTPPLGENQYSHEHEVLVAPHHGSELVHGDEVKKLLPYGKDLENTTPANIDQQINFKGGREGSVSPKFVKEYAQSKGRIPKKLAASEPMHKSENVDEDTNSLMNRQEDKYFLPAAKLAEFCRALQDQLKDGDIDTSARYQTNKTIYLDNRDMDSFKDNMEKVKPRFKVRIRQYKPNGEEWEDTAYVELKVKKPDGMTQKFRVRIPASEMPRIAQGGEIHLTDDLPNLNRDITKDVLWKRVASINGVIMKCGFRKQVVVEYNRRAFSSNELRVTVDDSLRFFDCLPVEHDVLESITNSDHWKRASKSEKKLLFNDLVIVEVKHETGTPDWVKKLLKENKAEEVSFSKYCGAIISHVLHGQKHEGMMSRNKAYNADQVLGYVLGQDSIQTLGKTETSGEVDLNVPVCDNQVMIDMLTKGFLRDAAVATSMAALMGTGGQAKADKFGDFMTRAIASVESNSGQNTAHKPAVRGMNTGESAVGKFGIMPKTAKDIARIDRHIGQKHPKLANMPDSQVAGYMKQNPGLEDELASSHLKRLRGIFGDQPAAIGMAWIDGVEGAKKAIAAGKDPKQHWHSKKIMNALKGLEAPKQKNQSLVDSRERK